MSRRLITPKETALRWTVSRSQLDKMRDAGIGPKPILVSPRRYAYLEAEVDAYIEELAQRRRPA